MFLLMKQTQKGSEDGNTICTFVEGDVYDVEESLAKVFLAQGWAVEAHLCEEIEEAPQPEPVVEQQTIEPLEKKVVKGKGKASGSIGKL